MHSSACINESFHDSSSLLEKCSSSKYFESTSDLFITLPEETGASDNITIKSTTKIGEANYSSEETIKPLAMYEPTSNLVGHHIQQDFKQTIDPFHSYPTSESLFRFSHNSSSSGYDHHHYSSDIMKMDERQVISKESLALPHFKGFMDPSCKNSSHNDGAQKHSTKKLKISDPNDEKQTNTKKYPKFIQKIKTALEWEDDSFEIWKSERKKEFKSWYEVYLKNSQLNCLESLQDEENKENKLVEISSISDGGNDEVHLQSTSEIDLEFNTDQFLFKISDELYPSSSIF